MEVGGGGGGGISPYIPEKLKNMHFPTIFAHDFTTTK